MKAFFTDSNTFTHQMIHSQESTIHGRVRVSSQVQSSQDMRRRTQFRRRKRRTGNGLRTQNRWVFVPRR